MASDGTMSSEGSSASRLRQFGLYKTIDSQTAEFLKLSRKRQIRRGCACAAVSTAITVTVVVCALLIYEYGFRRDYKMAPNTLRKFNWFKTVNETNATFNKTTPINYKNNGKLLAVILKALDQKRYLETLVEEHSSQRPAHESTTDYTFQKNVFADMNRKMPSKMYEGFKSTSHEFFKTRRKDSFAKARQITDYQRVMTYLNTMPFNKGPVDTVHTEVSSTSESNIKENQTVNSKLNNTRKKSYNRLCKCPPHSNLTEVLEKLYMSIQNLRPKAANNNTNCNRHKPNNTVKVTQSEHYFNNQTDSESRKNIQHIAVNTHPESSCQHSSGAVMSNSNSSKQNEITTSRKENNTVKYKNNDISYALPSTVEEMPWKLDFGIAAYDDVDGIYDNTGIKQAKSPPTGRMMESYASVKHTQIDEQEDFDEKYYNAVPEFAEIAQEPKTHYSTTEQYRSVVKYFDEMSEKLEISTIPSSVEYSTKKQLDTTTFSSELLYPVKYLSASAVKSTEDKEMQDRSHLDTTVLSSNDTVVERILSSLKKQKFETQSVKPKLELVKLLTPKKEDEKIPLAPMLHSHLLSKKDSENLNLGANTTSQRIEMQPLDSEELPFDLNFVSNEEDEQFRLLNDLHTVKVTTKTGQRCDRNNYESESENCREHKKKEKILSLSQIYAPMYVESRPRSTGRKPSTVIPKSSTEAPKNSGHKKSKIKEIHYMTGGELPVEDFDVNLKALMYYDKSPVNYTALATSYVNKIESKSIEMPKSMLPESRPSLLEIRRNHNHKSVDYTTHLYTSDEQI